MGPFIGFVLKKCKQLDASKSLDKIQRIPLNLHSKFEFSLRCYFDWLLSLLLFELTFKRIQNTDSMNHHAVMCKTIQFTYCFIFFFSTCNRIIIKSELKLLGKIDVQWKLPMSVCWICVLLHFISYKWICNCMRLERHLTNISDTLPFISVEQIYL